MEEELEEAKSELEQKEEEILKLKASEVDLMERH